MVPSIRDLGSPLKVWWCETLSKRLASANPGRNRRGRARGRAGRDERALARRL